MQYQCATQLYYVHSFLGSSAVAHTRASRLAQYGTVILHHIPYTYIHSLNFKNELVAYSHFILTK